MRTKLKREWIEALRSGKYDQAQSQLGIYNDEGGRDAMCCLGVLCDISLDYDEAPIILYSREDNDITFLFGTGPEYYVRDDSMPLGLFNDWAFANKGSAWNYSFELPSEPNVFDERGRIVELDLAALNDGGFTFNQIADIIQWAEPDE